MDNIKRINLKMSNLKVIVLIIAILAFIPAAHAQYDVVIVRGDNLVDSLVAQSYTQNEGIPLIAVAGGSLTKQVRSELTHYGKQGDKVALIIGGEEAVSSHINTELNKMGYGVERLWDWNRYGTAARVAVTLWGNADLVVVASNYEGNLMAASRTAMEDRVPLLITEPSALNGETKKAILELGASRIILVGEVSNEVRDSLSELGTIEQTKFTILRPEQPGRSGLFVIGIIIGVLVIFLFSSLWGAGFIKKTAGVPYDVLEKDEQKIVDILMNNEKITQNQLIKMVDFSRPKVSRVTSELEERGIIDKKRSGKTYHLILKRKIIGK